MFLISKNQYRIDSIAAFLKATNLFKDIGDVIDIHLKDDIYLTWSNVKPSDNLHIFKNGFIIGKIAFNELCSPIPIYHDSHIPENLHPLLQSVIIKLENDIIVIPNQHSLVYYSSKSISDHQLLIAKSDGLLPGFDNALVLCTVGYFPGNLTLFQEVQKIPFFESLSFPSLATKRYDSFHPRKCDDNLIIERLIEIIPEGVNNSIALSGGLDSRFVLGLLLRKGIKPKVYNFPVKEEQDIVKSLCERLGLEYSSNLYEPSDELTYTLLTDARIYFRGGGFGRFFKERKDLELFYNGVLAGIGGGNVANTAWKKPGLLSTIYDDLIWYVFLSNVPERIQGFKDEVNKKDIKLYLSKNLDYGKTYYEFKNRMQWAIWFCHLHRGLNWAPATVAEASFFTYPVHLLGDIRALEYEITSSALANLNKDRLKILNNRLLPHLKINYSSGRPHKPLPVFVRDVYNIYYEFFKRYFIWISHRRKMRGETDFNFNALSLISHRRLTNYFAADLPDLIGDKSVTTRVKRGAIIVNNVLKFLEV